jgi:ribosomal protein L13E
MTSSQPSTKGEGEKRIKKLGIFVDIRVIREKKENFELQILNYKLRN